jgi:SPX domain protein involved in polyphosphate accumulation
MIRIHSTEEELNQTFVLSLDKNIKDIFTILALKKKGINEKAYELRKYERSTADILQEGKSLSSSTPLKELDTANIGIIELEVLIHLII